MIETTTETTAADLAKSFETETCSRCCGSGQYSYCQMYGHTCFKCRGKGRTYTKRAEAAMAWAKAQRTVKVPDVQVGWLMYEAPGPLSGKTGWLPVLAVGIDTGARWQDKETGEWMEYYSITTEACVHNTFPTATVQAVASRDRLKEIREQALQYQSRLTKSGPVRKRTEAKA